MKGWFTVIAGPTLLATVAAAAQDRPAPRSPEQVFADKCVYCHDARGWGTRSLARRTPEGQAQLLDRQVLPAVLVQFAVRRGVGSMPQFTPTEISDAELDALAAWLSTRDAD